MFSESALLHIALILTVMVLFAKSLTRTGLEKSRKLSWKLRGKRRKLDQMFKRGRIQRIKKEQKRAALALKKVALEKKMEAIQWAGVAQWQGFNEQTSTNHMVVAELAAASA